MGERASVTSSSSDVLRSNDSVPVDLSAHTKLLTMIGVLLVMFLSALDSTIVSTAMPRIIADLQGFAHYTWVSTAYLLTSTVTVPIYGKVSDQIGRKPVFIFGLVVFLVGSALSGLAQSMDQLIAFRAFQGIGAGGLMSLAVAIVGDLFTPRERGKWQGATGAVFGIASIVGPLVGGWLTEYASWHWVFYVNVPIGLIALLVLIFVMPPLYTPHQRAAIDYVGALLIVAGFVPLLLAFSWGGSQYAWLSLQIGALLIWAMAALVVFFFYEARLARRGGEPILDPGLFRNSIFTISTMITMVTNMALYGSIFFIPLFTQGVLELSASESGLVLTPLLLASVVTSILSGQIVSRLGRYKAVAIIGAALGLLGQFLLFFVDVHTTREQVILAMVALGLGLGFSMSLYSLIVQNAMPTRIGQASSALVFFRSIGGTLALGLMGSVLNASYLPAFRQNLPPSALSLPPDVLAAFNNPQELLSSNLLDTTRAQFAAQGPQGQQLFQVIVAAMKLALVRGIHYGFLINLVLMALGLLLACFLPEIALRGKTQDDDVARERQAVLEPGL